MVLTQIVFVLAFRPSHLYPKRSAPNVIANRLRRQTVSQFRGASRPVCRQQARRL